MFKIEDKVNFNKMMANVLDAVSFAVNENKPVVVAFAILDGNPNNMTVCQIGVSPEMVRMVMQQMTDALHKREMNVIEKAVPRTKKLN